MNDHESSQKAPANTAYKARLAEEFVEFLPHRPRCLLSVLLLDQVLNIHVATTCRQIDIPRSHKLGLVDKLVRDVEENNNRSGQIRHEEVFHTLTGSLLSVANRCESDPELGDQDQAVEAKADPRANDTGLGAESQLFQSVALQLPGTAESDVAEADRAPGEDGGQTRDSHHPVESISLLIRCSQEAEQTDEGGGNNSPDGTTLAVNVGKEARSLALFG